MSIVSVAQRKRNCGVSQYAEAIERELQKMGVVVTPCDLRGAANCVSRTSPSGLIVHQEHSDGIRSGELLRLPQLLTMCEKIGIPACVVLHTVFSREDMRSFPIVGKVMLLYQGIVLRTSGRYANLITLNRAGTSFLQSHGIRVDYVPLGIFSAEPAEEAEPPGARIKVGVVGHPYAFKQYHLAASAYAGLPLAKLADVEFWIIGGEKSRDPAAFSRMYDILSSVPGANIFETGPLDERSFLKSLGQLDIALLPYKSRMQGSAVVSHVALSGCASIVSSSGAFDDLVACGGATRVANWEADASEALQRLIEEEPLRHKMSRAAAGLAASQPLSKTVGAILDILERSARAKGVEAKGVV